MSDLPTASEVLIKTGWTKKHPEAPAQETFWIDPRSRIEYTFAQAIQVQRIRDGLYGFLPKKASVK